MAKRKSRNQPSQKQIARQRAAAQKARRERQNKLIVAFSAVLLVVAIAYSAWSLWGQTTTDTAPESLGEGVLLEGERPLAQLEPAQRNQFYDEYPPIVIDPTVTYEAAIVTERGEMRLRLFTAAAPRTVNNFVFLANQGFYDNTTFHRVLEDFMAQAGDPTGTGQGGPGYRFEDEIRPDLVFDRPGLLAMANAGPGTNGSQFFITFEPTPWLDGRHTIFGELVEGEDVLAGITLRDPMDPNAPPGDLILRIEIYEHE